MQQDSVQLFINQRSYTQCKYNILYTYNNRSNKQVMSKLTCDVECLCNHGRRVLSDHSAIVCPSTLSCDGEVHCVDPLISTAGHACCH